METQTRLSRHNKFISAENIVGIFSVSSDDSFYMLCIVPALELYRACKNSHLTRRRIYQQYFPPK